MRERVYRAEEPELFGERTHAWENGVNPYYQKPSGKKKPKTQQQATYDTVSAQYDDSGTYTGPANTSYYPESAPATKPPSAVEALQNVRAKYEKPGDKKDARKRRQESFTTKSSASQIATVGQIARQIAKVPESTKQAQREWTVKDQNKRVNKEFNELVKGSVGVPYSRAYQKEARKNIRK